MRYVSKFRSREVKQPCPEPKPELSTASSHTSSFSVFEDIDPAQARKNNRCSPRALYRLEVAIGPVILVNLALVWYETDFRTGGVELETPQWVTDLNRGFLILYGLEALLHLYVDRGTFHKNNWNLFEVFIVAAGLTGEIVTLIQREGSVISASQMALIRTLRVLQILRVVRLMSRYRELWLLVRNMVSTLRTLFWAGLLSLIIILIWAILAVEYVHPLLVSVPEEKCQGCRYAFSSVIKSVFTLFQIMSGNSFENLWNEIIDDHPLVALFMIPMVFILVFGMMNLILAVVCENSAQARIEDEQENARKEQERYQKAVEKLRIIFDQLDGDGSGCLTLDEIKRGLRRNVQFRNLLEVLHVREAEVPGLFKIMDEDGSGEISAEEFTSGIYFLKAQDIRTTLSFITTKVNTLAFKSRAEELLMTELQSLDHERRALLEQRRSDAVAPLVRNEICAPLPTVLSELREPCRARHTPLATKGGRPVFDEAETPRWPHVLPQPQPTLLLRSASGSRLAPKSHTR